MNKVKVSVIVPIYNVEKYLSRCVESILQQTLKDIEIILINDGSKDGSLEIIREYEKNDQRIKVISHENQGLSGTRNVGLEHATAPYIMFVDGDDWIDYNTCQEAYERIKKEEGDVVMWPYIREYETQALEKRIFDGDMTFTGEETKKLHRRIVGLIGEELTNPEDFDSIVTAWGKLYRRDIIIKNNIKFTDLKEIGTWEDGLFNLIYFGLINKVIYINKPFNHYLKVNVGALTKTYKSNFYNTYNNLFDRIYNYIDTNNLEISYSCAFYNRIAMSILGIGLNECSQANPKSFFERIKFLKQILKDPKYVEAYRQLEVRYLPIHWKVFFLCAKYKLSIGIYILLQVINRIIAR